MNYDKYFGRGHRYAGATFARDNERHFGGSKPKDPPAPPPAPEKSDAEIQAAAASARQAAIKRKGRRGSILTGAGDAGAETLAGSEAGKNTLLGGS